MSRLLAFCATSALCAVVFFVFLATRKSGGEDIVFAATDVEGARELKPERTETANADADVLESEPWLAYEFHVPLEPAERLFPQLKSHPDMVFQSARQVAQKHETTLLF